MKKLVEIKSSPFFLSSLIFIQLEYTRRQFILHHDFSLKVDEEQVFHR